MLLSAPLLTLALSCTEEDDCTLATRAMMYCNLYRSDGDDGFVTDTIDTLTVTAIGTDSVIINAQTDVSDLTLPLRFAVDSTVLVFHYSDATLDTLIVRHTNTPYFLSMDCGYQMKQYLTGIGYTRHKLDSVYISNTEANIYGTENVRLYY